MLKTLRKTRRPTKRCSFEGLCCLLSKIFWTMQQMYSSRRRLFWIEIKQFCISLYILFTPVLELYCQTTYAKFLNKKILPTKLCSLSHFHHKMPQ
jgi:hypothetical protein